MIYREHYAGVEVTQISPITKKSNTLILEVTFEKFEKSLKKWNAGTMIQSAFPYLDADEREFILTGISSQDWNNIFPE